MNELINGGIEHVDGVEQSTIFTDVDIENGVNIPTNSFIEIRWRDATDSAEIDTVNTDPSDVLCVAITYGKFIKEDEKAVMVLLSEFLDVPCRNHAMCIPKGWIDYIKIIGHN